MTSARTVFRVSTLFPVSVIMYVSDRWVIFEVDKLKLKEKLKRYVYKECKAVLHSVAAVRCGPVRVVNSRSTREIKFTPVQTDATRKRTRDGTASIWVTLVLTQTPHRRRMPNAKTLVTALNIRVQYTTGNGRLALYVISISQRALSVRRLSTEY